MANYSLQIEPTIDNVYKSLKGNLLGNNKWIKNCLNILLTMDNSIVAFDAGWGNGKTFLAKQFQMIINEKWDMNYTNREVSEYNDIHELDFKNIINNSYYAIYYNAWEYDNENDPISSFLYYLLKMLNKRVPTDKVRKISSNLIKNVIEKLSLGWVKLSDEGKENTIENVLSSVLETEKVREEIKKLRNELKEEKFNNLVIIIDELDRCRPTYALKIVEMIKHYLKMENILIICMTDIKQLSNCIGSVYGKEYDSNMYLDKIFDFKFSIPTSNFDKKNYINMKIDAQVDDNYFFDMTCMEVIDYLDLTLRNIDKYIGYVKTMFIKSNNNDMNFTARAFVEYLFVPYYIGALLFKPTLYEEFLKGNFEDYFNFCKREKVLRKVKQIYSLSFKGENYDETKVFDYFKHDCELMVKQIKGERYLRENYYVDKGIWSYGVEYYIKSMDILTFFIKNTNQKQ